MKQVKRKTIKIRVRSDDDGFRAPVDKIKEVCCGLAVICLRSAQQGECVAPYCCTVVLCGEYICLINDSWLKEIDNV
jgi:hypothetical protein